MTAEILLVRHGACAALGRTLSGRSPGIHLNDEGRAQCRALSERLAPLPLAAVYTSPLERTRQTAELLAEPHRLSVRRLDGVMEIDFGEWTGMDFDRLEQDPRWHEWNAARGSARAPGGESMEEVRRRVVECLARLAVAHPGSVVVVVSHADVIRAALAHCLGSPLDRLLDFDVAPASVSALSHDGARARVRYTNRSAKGELMPR